MAEGKTLIVIGVEDELDPMMTPVLEKQITVSGRSHATPNPDPSPPPPLLYTLLN